MTNGRTVEMLPVVSIAIESIAIGERIGFYNQTHAERIGESMDTEGQHAPIQVKRNGNAAKLPWTLVAGLHRVRGAEFRGWAHIQAIQVADKVTTDADLRRLELAENLSHRFRRPIERAIMMAAHAKLEEAIDHPDHVGETRQQRGARVRNSASVTVTEGDGWRERTAKAFECAVPTLERHQRIYRDIVEALPDLAQALNDHPMGESFSNMRQLAVLPLNDLQNDRRRAALTLLSRDDWKSMEEVLTSAFENRGSKGNRVDPRNYHAVIKTTFEKMRLHEKRALLDDLPEILTKDMASRLAAKLVKRWEL